MNQSRSRPGSGFLAACLLAAAAFLAVPGWAEDDPCNATIVTSDGSMTAAELCDMIAKSGKNVTVFHSQCYGGDAAKCCNSRNGGGGGGGGGGAGGSGCHNSGGSPGELQEYGEYDQGTADALKPGSSAASVHQSGADNTSSTTPVDGGCNEGSVGEGDTVITFAGDPNQQDHDMGQQISDQNNNTTNLEGDGTEDGVEGEATAENLAAAIAGASSDNVWIWISDHGNMGGPSTAGVSLPGTLISLVLDFFDFLLQHMQADPGDTAWIFIESPQPFPAVLNIVFNGYAHTVLGEAATYIETGEEPFYRYLVPVPEEYVGAENILRMRNPTEQPFRFSAFVDTGPIAKIGGIPIEPHPGGDLPPHKLPHTPH